MSRKPPQGPVESDGEPERQSSGVAVSPTGEKEVSGHRKQREKRPEPLSNESTNPGVYFPAAPTAT